MIGTAFILALIGIMVCVYLIHIEQQLTHNPQYKPLCNISDKISCTQPIQSPYRAIFGISNAKAGIVYYALILICILGGFTAVLKGLVIAGLGASLYCAYILFFKIRVLCILCVLIYIINGALALTTFW